MEGLEKKDLWDPQEIGGAGEAAAVLQQSWE